ncbi:hypothetical protein [Bradyrhizobium sp. DASA03007]|uniref:hypothetical protein n=1 Tax=unclassified Bradyrhizobium TaxID=2631580 RepID=UPI003F723A14
MTDERDRFVVDFYAMCIVYDGGFSVPIVGMIDRFDMETDDPDEAEVLLVRFPPDGIILTMLIDDLDMVIDRTGSA